MACEFNSSTQTGRGYVAYLSEKTGETKLREITYAIVNGRAIFEGDIVINTQAGIATAEAEGANRIAAGNVAADMPAVPQAGEVVNGCVIVGAGVRWPNGVIPYTIDPALPNQARITNAIAHWQANTAIRFHVRTTETAYVTFTTDPTGCASNVGRQGGQQGIWLHSGCDLGNTIHEIGHTVGLWHEQSREDRNSYVTVHYENIIAGYEHNFDQEIAEGDDVGGYDYGSIMHYPRDAFTKNGLDTITPPAGISIGQRTALSAGDIAAVAFMYAPQSAMFVGNIRSLKLHVLDCRLVVKMKPANKRQFATVEAAKAAGYGGCHYCMPNWDGG
jgi:hypothetical protein